MSKCVYFHLHLMHHLPFSFSIFIWKLDLKALWIIYTNVQQNTVALVCFTLFDSRRWIFSSSNWIFWLYPQKPLRFNYYYAFLLFFFQVFAIVTFSHLHPNFVMCLLHSIRTFNAFNTTAYIKINRNCIFFISKFKLYYFMVKILSWIYFLLHFFLSFSK